MSDNPFNFVRDFLAYTGKHGIYDQYDKDSNKMVTSPGVLALIKAAESCLPKKLKPLEAAITMRDLNDNEREKLIQDAEAERIIDLRKYFQEKMSRNQGAMGLVERLVAAVDNDQPENLADIIQDAEGLVKGPENIS